MHNTHNTHNKHNAPRPPVIDNGTLQYVRIVVHYYLAIHNLFYKITIVYSLLICV